MHVEFEEAWKKRKKARTTVHGTLGGGSALRGLWKACRKLREVMQAAEDKYFKVYACKLEELTLAVDMKG